MANNNLVFIMFLLLLLHTGCCDDECEDCDECPVVTSSEGLKGKWNWIQSVGGSFGTGILTPESEGYAEYLVLDDYYYTKYRNDILTVQRQYDVEIRMDSLFGSNRFLVLETGAEFSVIQEVDTLILTEVCFDCYKITFLRE